MMLRILTAAFLCSTGLGAASTAWAESTAVWNPHSQRWEATGPLLEKNQHASGPDRFVEFRGGEPAFVAFAAVMGSPGDEGFLRVTRLDGADEALVKRVSGSLTVYLWTPKKTARYRISYGDHGGGSLMTN